MALIKDAKQDMYGYDEAKNRTRPFIKSTFIYETSKLILRGKHSHGEATKYIVYAPRTHKGVVAAESGHDSVFRQSYPQGVSFTSKLVISGKSSKRVI